MKKLVVLLLLTSMLLGCSAEETFEVVEDVIPVEPVAVPQQFFVSLPDEAVSPTFQDDREELYVCQGYTIGKQIVESGDIEKTVNTITGQSTEDIQIIQSFYDNCDRYDMIWSAAGEEGLQVGRACVLDDGNYHYILTTLAAEETAGQMRDALQDMYDSCKLLDPDINLSTGS